MKLIFQGRYALTKGHASRLQCSFEVNLWTKWEFFHKCLCFLRTQRKLMFHIYCFVRNCWFLPVSIHVCSWLSLTKHVENAAARSWSWFKWEDRGGEVIWRKYADTFFWGATSGKFLFENLTPFEKFRSSRMEEARPGGGIMNMRLHFFSCEPYRLHQSCLQ